MPRTGSGHEPCEVNIGGKADFDGSGSKNDFGPLDYSALRCRMSSVAVFGCNAEVFLAIMAICCSALLSRTLSVADFYRDAESRRKKSGKDLETQVGSSRVRGLSAP